MGQTEQAENTILAEFPRKHKETGAPEVLRVAASDFNGKLYLNARIFYRVKANGHNDDGFRPDKFRGISFREHELDAVIEALEQARALVHEQGRSTAPDARPPSRANPRPERPPTRSPGRQPERRELPTAIAGNREVPPWRNSDDDDLPY